MNKRTLDLILIGFACVSVIYALRLWIQISKAQALERQRITTNLKDAEFWAIVKGDNA